MIPARYKRWETILCCLVALLAASAIARHPYGYYTLVRWVVFLSGAFLAYQFFAARQTGFAVLFGAAGAMFNPLVPFHLDRGTWEVFDLLCAAVFLLGAAVSPRLEST